MKVLVVSDNHSSNEELQNLVERHQNEVECMIHCGDSEFDYDASEMLPFQVRVSGNCDYDHRYPDESVDKVGNKTVFTTHGHLYNVKMTLMKLQYKAEEVQADLVCFGHSHEVLSVFEEGTLFLNPGSVKLPRKPPIQTYAIVEWSENDVSVTYRDENGEIVEDLSKIFSLT
ncbi:metallophosphoesterase [Alkalihalobacillus hwajinpoensis]|uniref:metallophosphoesterase n=1 Tax=Guptibacillus hwajinpoensis TaxID=208199 RepID=UPI001883658D|nr:metallophosphoesterase [Pseudalkalibacillus hwajinpoensis]MBF0706346.1 metallophosphoesterase [Pseudalkalibacillus hwajinpoensis]